MKTIISLLDQLQGQAVFFILVSVQLIILSCTQHGKEVEPCATKDEAVPMKEYTNIYPENLVFVALIDNYENIESVQEELKANNIACYIEGSLGYYSVSVIRADAARARKILRDAKRVNHTQVQLIPEGADSIKNDKK